MFGNAIRRSRKSWDLVGPAKVRQVVIDAFYFRFPRLQQEASAKRQISTCLANLSQRSFKRLRRRDIGEY